MLSLLNRTARGRFHFVAAAAMGCALVAFSAPAFAQDDEETFEQKLLRGFLGGNQKNLEYRERSPLVIPPSRELPAPDRALALQNSPAWPNDPDARKRAASGGGFVGADEAERANNRMSTPDELRRGTARGKGRVDQPHVTLSDNESARVLRPNELGGKNPSLFSMFGSSKAPEGETFKEEPVRSRMTEPPPGYRTPSPSQPYAPPKDTGGWFKLPDPWSRGIGDWK